MIPFSFNPIGFDKAAVIGGNIPLDYILRYDFSGNILDSSTHSNNGVPINLMSYTNDRKGNPNSALLLNNNGLYTNDVNSINTNKLSLSFWIKTITTSTALIFELSRDANDVSNSFFVSINNVGVGTLQVVSKGSNTVWNLKGVDSVLSNTGLWQHVVVVMNRDNDGINESNIYINGSIVSSSILLGYNNDINDNFSSNVLYIGQRNGGVLPFDGILDDVRFYNRILTQNEIQLLYNE